jgi:hypothetical protein
MAGYPARFDPQAHVVTLQKTVLIVPVAVGTLQKPDIVLINHKDTKAPRRTGHLK